MTPDLGLVATIVGVLLVLTVAATVDLTLGSAVRRRRLARRKAQEREALGVLVDVLDLSVDVLGAATVLRRQPASVIEETLSIAARSFGGADRDRLREVAAAAGVPGRAIGDLDSRRWATRLRAIRLLTITSPSAPGHRVLHDPDPEVRAAATLWAGQAVSAVLPGDPGGQHAALTSALGVALLDPSSLVRLAAKHAVVSASPPAAGAVELALVAALEVDRGTRTATPPDVSLGPVAPLAVAAALPGQVRLEVLTPFLDDPAAVVRAAATRAVAGAAPARIEDLCAAGSVDEAPVRAAVAAIAGRDLATVHHLVTLAADPVLARPAGGTDSLHRLGPVGRVLGRRVQHDAGRPREAAVGRRSA